MCTKYFYKNTTSPYFHINMYMNGICCTLILKLQFYVEGMPVMNLFKIILWSLYECIHCNPVWFHCFVKMLYYSSLHTSLWNILKLEHCLFSQKYSLLFSEMHLLLLNEKLVKNVPRQHVIFNNCRTDTYTYMYCSSNNNML